jgi:hypothetical protein
MKDHAQLATSKQDSNLQLFFGKMLSDGSYNNFGRSYFKMKNANLTEVEPATEYYFSQILLLGDPDSLLLGKEKLNLKLLYFL